MKEAVKEANAYVACNLVQHPQPPTHPPTPCLSCSPSLISPSLSIAGRWEAYDTHTSVPTLIARGARLCALQGVHCSLSQTQPPTSGTPSGSPPRGPAECLHARNVQRKSSLKGKHSGAPFPVTFRHLTSPASSRLPRLTRSTSLSGGAGPLRCLQRCRPKSKPSTALRAGRSAPCSRRNMSWHALLASATRPHSLHITPM